VSNNIDRFFENFGGIKLAKAPSSYLSADAGLGPEGQRELFQAFKKDVKASLSGENLNEAQREVIFEFVRREDGLSNYSIAVAYVKFEALIQDVLKFG